MRASFELLCFDLDGTLVDSAPDLSLALGNALVSVGLRAPTQAQTRSWIGDGIDNLLRRALESSGTYDDETFRKALNGFHNSYARNIFRRGRLYPGVEPVLQSLLDTGLRLCCITNKRTDYAIALLDQAGIAEYFEFVFGGDSFPEKKPHPRQLLEASLRADIDRDRCVMIGDSDTDSNAATAAGFAFIWASFGYCLQPKSRDIQTVARADEFTEIPLTLATMMS